MYDQHDLIARGLARLYRGRLIPVMKGGDGREDDTTLFPDVPEDYTSLSVEELDAFVAATLEGVRLAATSAEDYITDEFTDADLRAEIRLAIESITAAKAELKSRADDKPAEAATVAADLLDLAELAAEAEAAAKADEEPEPDEPDEEPEPEPDEKPAADDKASIVASGGKTGPAKRALPKPRASREAPIVHALSMTAAAPNLGFDVGQDLPDAITIARMMEQRRAQFGLIPKGTRGEKIPIARADWTDRYPAERRLTGDTFRDMELVAAAVDQDAIKRNMALRRDGALTASGGLCAPVTPYYDLQMVSVAQRPVRAALAAFNADRGGIRFAQPATLASITTAVGVKTAAEDGAGGTEAEKTCQVVDCPPFQEVDVQVIYHCLQFGNLGARTFPERVAQWNNLVLAAQARLAESELLTGIDEASTQVTASSLGLGASATLPSQILAAAEGMRSRHRMDPDAVLRVILPQWVLSLLVSDVYRSQFDRFSMTPADFVALLRAGNVEPTFHIDGANGRGQVFDVQSPGGLDTFPANVVWYLYPEGSFLFVDGGVLELGLVRDSVLNKTNDFQIFGEAFENVAFVGVESLAVETPVCDTGIVSGPTANTVEALACPYEYAV